jgi:hypothetical protein
MANNAFYPVSPAPRTVAGVIKLDASRIAHWATIGATHAAIMGEHAMLFAGGKLLASDAPASTATHAVWVNVATREKMESKLATILRTVSGKKGRGQVRRRRVRHGGKDGRSHRGRWH